MNIRFLETLIWLNRLKSFSRTAEKLNTTQPAVTSRIQKLEDLLNLRLFDRNAKMFELTPAGRRVLAHAERIVALSAELHAMGGGVKDGGAPLRVGVIELVTLTWFPTMLSLVSEEFPDAVIEFSTGTTPQLIEELKKGQRDVVFVVGPVNEPNVSNIPISAIALEWMANPSKFDCHTPIDVVGLSRMPVMMGAENSSGRNQMTEYFRRYGIVDVPSRGYRMRLDLIYSLATAAQVVTAGLGVAALPTFLLADALKAGTVARLPVRQPVPPFEIIGCFKLDHASMPLVQSVTRMALAAAAAYCRDSDPAFIWTWGPLASPEAPASDKIIE